MLDDIYNDIEYNKIELNTLYDELHKLGAE